MVPALGRTIPSYRIALEDEIETWENFRKALRSEDRQVFDDMIRVWRSYGMAGTAAARPVLSEVMFMVLLLNHHKQLSPQSKRTKESQKLLAQFDGNKSFKRAFAELIMKFPLRESFNAPYGQS